MKRNYNREKENVVPRLFTEKEYQSSKKEQRLRKLLKNGRSVLEEAKKIKKMLGNENCLYILTALQRKPMRFSQIQKLFIFDPVQLDSNLEFLSKEFWIIAHVVPAKGKFLAVWRVSKRGKMILTLLGMKCGLFKPLSE
ncbi:MAG: hypothetical protein A3I89_03270 [Candidatus Harrisonbacteria bacterium RIFCSPLOWO2_02_FULL_41_11]|uniref:HTH arsR-type domain-containing protein n=1 Tax=Candidatus Harrisonbacteria bacterium RIFCSPHIGHO2_02_FULL_42_16 TaxID=1798404 RepID=A0A1G1ZKR2_9BACT|nr:MAG: hypothetical protein A3B92_02760 [Candidatus Harrisonbacteria bacterium RIFCSPHIGHO2_02_FULL_42_16]OGY66259.1 MAG: hypothetical protein A3I89_03270 [Candidatus Harrisonbacteria bacterium RIFCSPLOWO2_02_FULL_41_11]